MKTEAHGLITEEEVRLTAALSELHLDDAELPRITAALEAMLSHFEVVSRVAGGDADDGATNPVENRVSLADCRADEPRAAGLPATVRRDLTAASPDFEDEFYFVPRIK